MVVTTDVDVPLLVESFDLGPFDGFLDSDLWEHIEVQARCQAASQRGAAAPADEAAAASHPTAGGDGLLGEDQQQGVAAARCQPEAAAEVGAVPESRVRSILARLVEEALTAPAATGAGARRQEAQHRLFAVTMLCLDAAWEAHEGDLLAAAFEQFPAKVCLCAHAGHVRKCPQLAGTRASTQQ
jgi:hypothetical protein